MKRVFTLYHMKLFTRQITTLITSQSFKMQEIKFFQVLNNMYQRQIKKNYMKVTRQTLHLKQQ